MALVCISLSCAGAAQEEAPEMLGTSSLAVHSDRIPRPAPPMSLTSAEHAKFVKLPARANAIPVVLFHAICNDNCPTDDLYTLRRSELIRILLMFGAAGYKSVTPGQYVRFMHGDKRGLPAQPILVTFDDGHASAYLEGDAVLQGLGVRATMFVITDRPETKDDAYVRWTEWRTAVATGRWNVQLHAHAGHVTIPARVDEAGAVVNEASYAVRAYDPALHPTGDHLETFAAWQSRTEGDIEAGRSLLATRLNRAYEPLLFAVPFGNFGQRNSNDPAIEPEMRTYLDGHFEHWFTQVGNAEFTVPSTGTHERNRYTILNTTKAEGVYAWLKRRAIE
jgi:Polysaccharide deacetylase